QPPEVPPAESGSRVLALSAKNPASLQALARKYIALFADDPTLSFADVCGSAFHRRSRFEQRLGVPASSVAELVEKLEAFTEAGEAAGAVSGHCVPRTHRKIAFVYSGHGSQWVGMARDLMQASEVFRTAMTRCATALAAFADWSLMDELEQDDGRLARGENAVVQPSLFAIAVSLTAVLQSWGIEPAAVLGHSMGEVAAAHVAGVLSLEDAAKVICIRSKIVRSTLGRGGMLLADLTLAQAQEEVTDFSAEVSVAVNNGPRS